MFWGLTSENAEVFEGPPGLFFLIALEIEIRRALRRYCQDEFTHGSYSRRGWIAYADA
jgi:hypothetical protein